MEQIYTARTSVLISRCDPSNSRLSEHNSWGLGNQDSSVCPSPMTSSSFQDCFQDWTRRVCETATLPLTRNRTIMEHITSVQGDSIEPSLPAWRCAAFAARRHLTNGQCQHPVLSSFKVWPIGLFACQFTDVKVIIELWHICVLYTWRPLRFVRGFRVIQKHRLAQKRYEAH